MLKIGVIGAGHLGRIHIEQIKNIDNFQLLGFFDHNNENAEKIAKELGITHFEKAEELMDLCDAVDVVTPTLSHYEYAARAIKKSKHVFIEKPLTNTVEEAKKLIELAREAKVIVQVGHVERFNPAFLAALPFFDNPMFIETHRLAQFNTRGTDVPVVLDLMIHDIDIVLSIVKSNVKRISASGVAVVSETPDIANARIEFDNGCVANLTASRISLKNMRKSRFFQRDAYITIDFLDKEVNIIKLKPVADEIEADPFAMIIDTGVIGKKKQIYFENPPVNKYNAILQEFKGFAEAISSKTSPKVTLEDGCNALEIAHRILDHLSLVEDIV